MTIYQLIKESKIKGFNDYDLKKIGYICAAVAHKHNVTFHTVTQKEGKESYQVRNYADGFKPTVESIIHKYFVKKLAKLSKKNEAVKVEIKALELAAVESIRTKAKRKRIVKSAYSIKP